MRALVVTHPTPKDIRKIIDIRSDDYVIAVDQAVLDLYKQRIPIDLAVGDFDSLKNKGILTQLNVVELNPVKDVTDTYQALLEAEKRGYKDLILIGGIGGKRIEHFIGHLTLFDSFSNLEIIDDNSRVEVLHKGIYEMSNEGYISVFGYPSAVISETGFKYDLDHYDLKLFDALGISNEIKNKKAQLTIHEGRVLLVVSKFDMK